MQKQAGSEALASIGRGRGNPSVWSGRGWEKLGKAQPEAELIHRGAYFGSLGALVSFVPMFYLFFPQ